LPAESGLAGNRGNADRGLREQVPHHVELGARVARFAAQMGAIVIGLSVSDTGTLSTFVASA